MRIYETNKKLAKKYKNNYISLLYVLPYIIANIFAEVFICKRLLTLITVDSRALPLIPTIVVGKNDV